MGINLASACATLIAGFAGFSFIHPALPQPSPKKPDWSKPADPPKQPAHNFTNSTIITYKDKRDKLELEKLRAEIDKLEYDRGTGRYTLFLQFGTLFSALLAAAISAWSATRAQRLQIASQNQQRLQSRQERISHLLQQFGSENPRSRVAAARAIGEYPESTTFLVDALQSESDNQVVDTIIASLKTTGGATLKTLRDATIAIRRQEILLIAKLITINEPIDNIATVIGLNIQGVKEILASEDAVEIQLGESKRKSAVAIVYPSADSCESRSSLLQLLWRLQESHAIVRRAIEEVAAHLDAGFPGDLRNANLRFINLSRLNLEQWVFDNADLTMSNLSDSTFDGSSFRRTHMTKAVLQRSSFKNCDFSSADLGDSNFKMAKLHDAIFDDSSCKAAKFSGAKLTRTSFRGTQLHAAKFINVFAKNVVFDGAKLFRCNFSSSLIGNSSFRGSNLSGAQLNGVKAIGADFTNAILSGTSIKGSSLQGALFAGAKLQSLKEVGGTDFSGASFLGASFENSEWLERHVASLCDIE